MKTKFLVAALACLSMVAGAQQSDEKKDPATKSEVKSPRDHATGQASGRRMNQAAENDAASSNTARETASGMATGRKTMAHDDWQSQKTAISGDPHVQEVSASGNGQSELRESPSKASTGKTEVRESPSKPSSGGTTMVRESPSKASLGKTSVVAGDLDGDGRADKTAASSDGVKSPRDIATGQASGKRQHKPMKEQMEKSPRN